MPLLKANLSPSERQLRQFAAICAVALPGVSWLWGAGNSVLMLMALTGLLIAVVGWFKPKLVLPLFIGLTVVTIPLGIVMGELALLAIYAFVFFPISILFRLAGRDRLQLKKPSQAIAESYWSAKPKPKSLSSYYRQS